ncbi:MAG: cupin domain-containing protein [Saprospiraceae bacterium]|nr:cupin domain-containing protein [Saprospiraceae bacterium]
MKIIHENEIPEIQHPGRYMRWLANADSLNAKNLSVCVIRVLPGETVRPAHSHPLSEELIYIIVGSGRVMVEDEVEFVEAGSAVLFEQGKIHMLKNTGDEEMKVICFFAPATSVENYRMFEEIEFPE